MADSTIATANTVQQWNEKAYVETIGRNQFAPYMSKKHSAPVLLEDTLQKKFGDKVTVSFVSRLTNAPIMNDDTVEGNEESLANGGHAITIERYANAVRIGEHEARKTAFDWLQARGAVLLDWMADLERDQIIEAALSANVDGSTPYASCTVAERNAWVTAQAAADRVLFGAAVGNYSAGDMAASLLNIDSVNDTLTPGVISLAKRVFMRKVAGKFRPVPLRTDGNINKLVMFAPPEAFRDLKNHATIVASLQNAAPRSNDNILFQDGDIEWDGVIVHEVQEISTLTGVGAAAIDVAPCFLMGAGAIGMAVGEKPNVVVDESMDYQRKNGAAIQATHGIDKLMYNNVQVGMMNVFVSGVADA